jgi:hypothetical protein
MTVDASVGCAFNPFYFNALVVSFIMNHEESATKNNNASMLSRRHPRHVHEVAKGVESTREKRSDTSCCQMDSRLNESHISKVELSLLQPLKLN